MAKAIPAPHGLPPHVPGRQAIPPMPMGPIPSNPGSDVEPTGAPSGAMMNGEPMIQGGAPPTRFMLPMHAHQYTKSGKPPGR